jgi:hypothetical protein
MPELGPYGSMRGEVRENLPYRDLETKNRAYEIKCLRVPNVSLALPLHGGGATRAAVCANLAERIAFFAWRRGGTFPSSQAPRYGSAPVREKRVGLSRSLGHRGYGHSKRSHCFLERRRRGLPHLSCDGKVHPAASAAPIQPSCDRDGRLRASWLAFHRGVPGSAQ